MNTQLKKGILELLVLHFLNQHESYGYELIQTISDFIPITDGTIYPILSRLARVGLIESYLKESPSGPPRKYYRLSTLGRQTYYEQYAEWLSFSEAVQQALGGKDNDC